MNSIKAAREIEKITPFWNLTPNNSLLLSRNDNEAYLTSKAGETYIVFFPNGGGVELDLTAYNFDFTLQWMNVREGQWHSESVVKGNEKVVLKAPNNNQWVGVVNKK